MLAFGDSFTAGWRGRGVTQHSWTLGLSDLLNEAVEDRKWRVIVDPKGRPGEQAVDMPRRHDNLRTQTYHIVILQGGGNDIRLALEADAHRTDGVKIGEQIAAALLGMAQHWISTNAKVALLISRGGGHEGNDFGSVATRTVRDRLVQFVAQNGDRAKIISPELPPNTPHEIFIDPGHQHATALGNDDLARQFSREILPFVDQIIARRSGDDTRERDRSRSPTRKQST